MRMILRRFTSVVLGLIGICGTTVAAMDPAPAEFHKCRLATTKTGFLVKCDRDFLARKIEIPRDLLMPPAALEAESDDYVSSFRISDKATGFTIGQGLLGLHLSSYDMQSEGSAQAAAGRDWFMVYDPKRRAVRSGGIDLGVTKSRLRFEGCFAAVAHVFYVADVNADGALDIGVRREEVKCIPWETEDQEGVDGPFYCQEPIHWYVFGSGAWVPTPTAVPESPAVRQELPLIGLAMSPVAYVRRIVTTKACEEQTRR